MITFLRSKPKTSLIFILTLLSTAFHLYASKILNASYELSQFPVPYYEAQLSFSAEKIQAWYSYLIDQQTLNIYIKTQHIDFLFILSVLLLHFLVLLLISRFFKLESKGRTILIVCALLSTLAPLCDALENFISYIMLMKPTSFASIWAIIYSSFATVKFAAFTFAYIAAIIGILVGLLSKIKSKFKGTNASFTR